MGTELSDYQSQRMIQEQIEQADLSIWSGYTHPKLEELIDQTIKKNEKSLPTMFSKMLLREFFLYGFMEASNHQFALRDWSGYIKHFEGPMADEGEELRFYTNNGVLALSDEKGHIYIRGGDGYHNCFPDLEGMPEAVEGTLFGLGYQLRSICVIHSNGEIYADSNREELFGVLRQFSLAARQLRGEPTSGMIIKDFEHDEPKAVYGKRDPSLPQIILPEPKGLLIPGNKEKTIMLE